MENTNGNNQTLVWAVVDSGTRKLVGKVPPDTAPGQSVYVREAVQLDTGITRVPTPQGVGALFSPALTPVDLEDTPVDVFVLVANIRFFSDMPDRGKRMTETHDEFMGVLLKRRAERAGIISPTSGPPSSPRFPRG